MKTPLFVWLKLKRNLFSESDNDCGERAVETGPSGKDCKMTEEERERRSEMRMLYFLLRPSVGQSVGRLALSTTKFTPRQHEGCGATGVSQISPTPHAFIRPFLTLFIRFKRQLPVSFMLFCTHMHVVRARIQFQSLPTAQSLNSLAHPCLSDLRRRGRGCGTAPRARASEGTRASSRRSFQISITSPFLPFSRAFEFRFAAAASLRTSEFGVGP